MCQVSSTVWPGLCAAAPAATCSPLHDAGGCVRVGHCLPGRRSGWVASTPFASPGRVLHLTVKKHLASFFLGAEPLLSSSSFSLSFALALSSFPPPLPCIGLLPCPATCSLWHACSAGRDGAGHVVQEFARRGCEFLPLKGLVMFVGFAGLLDQARAWTAFHKQALLLQRAFGLGSSFVCTAAFACFSQSVSVVSCAQLLPLLAFCIRLPQGPAASLHSTPVTKLTTGCIPQSTVAFNNTQVQSCWVVHHPAPGWSSHVRCCWRPCGCRQAVGPAN